MAIQPHLLAVSATLAELAALWNIRAKANVRDALSCGNGNPRIQGAPNWISVFLLVSLVVSGNQEHRASTKTHTLVDDSRAGQSVHNSCILSIHTTFPTIL